MTLGDATTLMGAPNPAGEALGNGESTKRRFENRRSLSAKEVLRIIAHFHPAKMKT
jgi:hypothetical protein